MLAEVEKIKRDVAKKYGINVKDMDGADRGRRISRARIEAMSVVREKTSCSFPEIGYYFGRRHHSTVVHACKVYARYPKRFSKGWF